MTTEDIHKLSFQLIELMDQGHEPSDQEIRTLMNQGADANLRPANMTISAMHVAARFGYAHAISVMVACGATTKEPDGDFRTPLMDAARYNRVEVIKVLLALGADPLVTTSNGITAFDCAASGFAVETLQLLLAAQPANKQALDKRYASAALCCVCRCAPIAEGSEEFAEKIVDMLLEAGADATITDDSESTPLMYAVKHHGARLVAKLLPISGDVNRVNETGSHALHCAAYGGNLENIELLLEAGADVSAYNKAGDGCIGAVMLGMPRYVMPSHVKMLRLLAAAGACVNKADRNGNTPLISTLIMPLSQKSVAEGLAEILLDLGAHIPEGRGSFDVMEMREVDAQKRFDEVMQSATPDMQHISTRDLIWFSNINRLSDVLQPSLWRGYEAHLSQVLTTLPPALVDEVMAQQPGLVEMLQPGTKLSEWSHEMQACREAGRA